MMNGVKFTAKKCKRWWSGRVLPCLLLLKAPPPPPPPPPGAGIIDEEHESSYKQEETPRYHARDVAIERAKSYGCPVILGSATPTLESFARAKKNVYKLLTLARG